MNKEDLEEYEGKKIKLILHSNSVFTGKVIRITNEALHMVDKFNQDVTIDLNQISNVIGLDTYIPERKEAN